MTANADRARLLRDSLEAALTDVSFGRRFYDHLFEAHPEARAMFRRNSDGAQQKMFAQKLCAIVDSIEDESAFAAEARAIARTHKDYGVRPEMYAWVGAALIQTLREAAGAEWSPEAERAWTEAYEALSKSLLASS